MIKFLIGICLSFSVQAACVDMGQRQYDALVLSLVESGKGTREINEIIKARTSVCRGQCVTGFGICILDVNKDKK